jgi:hypothetical protein
MRKTLRSKIIIYILLLMTIGMSLFFYYYITNIDNEYTSIITNEINLYNNIQNVTFGSNRGYILLYKIFETNDPTKRDSLINEKLIWVTRNDSLINEIIFNLPEYKDKTMLNDVITAREHYIQNVAKFEKYVREGVKDEARDLLINQIEPNFYQYQSNLKAFIQSNSSNVIEHSGNITSGVKRNSYLVLLFGLSPIIMFSIFLFILGIFLILMLVFLKDVKYER